jgi:hypothetical protein
LIETYALSANPGTLGAPGSGKNTGNFSILVQFGSKENAISLDKSDIYSSFFLNQAVKSREFSSEHQRIRFPHIE